MTRTRQTQVLFAALLTAAPWYAIHAQGARSSLADRLATSNYVTDYAGGVAEARANSAALRDPRARAWYALLLARDGQERIALAIAYSMLAADRRSPWGWLARAGALEYGQWDSSQAALAASDSLYRRAPHHPDAVWARAATLMNNSNAAGAIAVVDSFLAGHPNATRFLVLRANATYSVGSAPRTASQARKDSALSLYARARAMDSTDVQAWAAAASRLLGAGRIDEAVALLRRAVELAPLSLAINASYWGALRRRHARDLEQARNEALPGVARLLAARGEDPAVLLTLTREYESFHLPDSQRTLQDRILRDHPASGAAEWVLVERYRDAERRSRDTTIRDSTAKDDYRRLLREFMARPTHVNDMLLGDAYRQLFFLADSTTDPDTLLTLVLGMERYEGINPHIIFAQGAIALADHHAHLDQAERLAREGVRAGRRRIDGQRQFYETDGDYAQAQDWMSSLMADALGWVFFQAGRADDARRELRRALDLSPKNASAFAHLGRILEAGGQPDSAESYYIRGALVQSPLTNPSRAALRSLYVKRNGSAQGYDAYHAGIRDRDRARRHAAVLAEIRATRGALPAFDLAALDGGRVRSDSLAGHVTVVNFWGKWCGPCIAEMPDLQRFWRTVAGDSTVRFTTINNDGDLADLRDWMRQHHYDVPALVDSGYAGRNEMHVYPTTWFVDRAGRIAFVKQGWNEDLVEEFGWRIDALKAEP